MRGFKAPDFNERAALSRQAKEKALAKLKAKPPVDEAVIAERAAARAKREAAELEKREAKRAAAEQAEADKKAAAEQAIRDEEAAAEAVIREAAEQKAARDARYAARKNRK